jgi:hypothetical protein
MAHSEVVTSDPAPGAVLATPPAAVFIEFDGQLSPESAITVQDAAFQPMQRGEALIVDPTDPHVLAVNLNPLPPGGYTVQWTSVDPQDGHSTTGSYAFAVRPEGASPGRLPLLSGGILLLAVLAGLALARRRRAGPPPGSSAATAGGGAE